MSISKSCAVVVAIVGLCGVVSAEEKVECTIKALSCGEAATPSLKIGTCFVLAEKKIGTPVSAPYFEVYAFMGTRMKDEILSLGGGIEAGVLIVCSLPGDPNSKKPDYDVLRKELPRLIAGHPEIKKTFPSLKKVEVFEKMKFSPFTQKCEKEVKAHEDYKSLFQNAK
ncbi:MAG: hypothetical protein V4719_18280 [Planctomycetota bacterium]